MYIKKLTRNQILDLLKTMLLYEARTNSYYNSNIKSILDNSLIDYSIKSGYGNDYLVAKVKNGDLFVFDDCNYIKFEVPNMKPISLQKNTNVYLNYMRETFSDYNDFERVYNQEAENIVNIVNFCDDLINSKTMQKTSSNRDYAY